MWSDNGGGNYFSSEEPLVKNYIIDLPNAASWQRKQGRNAKTERNSSLKINSLSALLPVKAERRGTQVNGENGAHTAE